MLPQGNEETSDTVAAELSELAQQKGGDIANQSPGNLVLFAIGKSRGGDVYKRGG